MRKESIRIDPLGHGLTVLIRCEATGADNFLAFASWYSFVKNLPDARLAIACRRPEDVRMDVFPWVYRARVPFFYYRNSEPRGGGTVLTVPPHVLCLSPLDDQTLESLNAASGAVDVETYCLPAKSDQTAIFCSVRTGCGSFVPDRWIHKGGHPFGKVELFSRGPLTVNEKRVFSLWKKLCPLYDTLV